MSTFRAVSLILATITTGLMAGFYAAFSHTVMPGLARTRDETFVPAFRAIDGAVRNPWFLVVSFFGAVATGAAAVVASLGHDVLPWTIAGLAVYAASVIITSVVNVPLNQTIQAADVTSQQPGVTAEKVAVARASFHERRWTVWNHVRALTCTTALVLYASALLIAH